MQDLAIDLADWPSFAMAAIFLSLQAASALDVDRVMRAKTAAANKRGLCSVMARLQHQKSGSGNTP
ncbi:hypothetical protein D3C72_2164660 [compost metagenome]